MLSLTGLVLTVPNARAALWTQDTDTDFNAGSYSSTETAGSGTAAVVQLAQTSTDWRNQAPPSNLGIREGVSLVYDPTNDVVVAFGGYDGVVNYGDTWEYSPPLNTWTQTSVTGPSPRSKSAIAFDSANGRVVLFGGVSDTANEADTWEYNAVTNAWVQTTPATSPPSMMSYAMAYNSAASRSVLVGLNVVPPQAMRTWAYDAGADLWADRGATFSPARFNHAVTYHTGFNRLVLFGGFNPFPPPGTIVGDTWEYNYAGNSWTLTVADGAGPPARHSMGLSYRSTDAAVWMFGGSSAVPLSDTRRYFDVGAGRQWSGALILQRAPSARHTFGMTSEAASNGKSYLYGGIVSGGGRSSETWSLGPAFGSSGTWDSQTFDSMGANVNWNTISWVGATPPMTTISFQTATSIEPNPPLWTYIGGVGCNFFSYYSTSGATICPSQDGQRYLRVRLRLTTTDNLNSPTMDSVTIDYTVAPSDPFIVFHDPPGIPDPGAFNVPLTDPILIRFSEEMNIGTVLYTITPPIGTSDSWSDLNSLLTISHAALFPECAFVTVEVTAGADLAGNPLNNGLNRVPNPWTFTTLCTPPEIVSTSPIQGEVDVLLDAPIVVDFSEAMATATVNWTITPFIALNASWTMGDSRLTLTHAANFTQCQNFLVNVTGEDLPGNALVPGVVPNPWDFTTECTIPFIVFTNPADLQTGVSTTAAIVVQFSEPMDTPTVTWDIQPFTNLNDVWSNGDRTLTLSHAFPWPDCMMATMEITAGKDLVGNDLGPGPAPNPWQFATTCPAPFIVSTDPPDGATGVDQFADIVILFSEPMNTAPGGVTVTITPLIPVTYAWGGLDQILTVSHGIPFACGVNSVLVDGFSAGGIPLWWEGLAPNPFTLSPLCTDPFIASTDPADGATGVPTTAPILIEFSEPMNTLSVIWDVVPLPPGGFTEGWSAGDTILTLSHGSPLVQNTEHNAVVIYGEDVDGNVIITGPAANPWRFTTGGISPEILSTDPADGATGVPLDYSVTVVFSEPMNTGTVVATPSPFIALTYSWDLTDTTLTLGHGLDFADCTLYTFDVTGSDTTGDGLGPGPVPNPWSFMTVCVSPLITNTNPAAGATDVPVDAPVWVNFSKAMDRATVVASPNPGIPFTYTWFNGDTTLRLTHGTFFGLCTVYSITVTGSDTGGSPLVPGPVPNPWTFRTFCDPPFIVSTDPADGQSNVPTGAVVVVTFSRAMNIGTVTAQFTPLTTTNPPAWTNGNTVLTLTPNPALLACQNYQVFVQGQSVEGKNLVPGPVPNPWTFDTVCSVGAPAGLTATRSPPTDVRLAWAVTPSADFYRVYESRDRFAAWPWTPLGTTTNTFFDAPHLGDGLSHFYIVRAVRATTEGGNSTMASKIEVDVGFIPGRTNIRWFSLPHRSEYSMASEIAGELGPGKIDVLGKWDAATQRTLLYYYFRGRWQGNDFLIAPGDGLFLSSVSAFPWVIVGTDRGITHSFTFNAPPLTNFNWVGVPYTGTYDFAIDLVRDIEGGTGPGTNTKIVEVAKWDAATQTLLVYSYSGVGWIGNDFAIDPGDAVYFRIVADFTWQPDLITPEVP
ncbi:MAG TPA: Ig-like domain-containing protein [Thermoplasmata archaeon]|nr:Ig-like domain-containing protein [Thermoplasmata archaeon]